MSEEFRNNVAKSYNDRIEVTLQSYVGKDNTQEIRDELKVALEKALKEAIAEEIAKLITLKT